MRWSESGASRLIVMMLREGLEDAIVHREESREKTLAAAIAALAGTTAASEIEAIKRRRAMFDSDGPNYPQGDDE